MKEELSFFFRSITNSYSAIFFSRSRWFGILLILLTMLYPAQGCCGLFCCMLVNSISISLELNRYKIETGLYGFNAVLVGIALGTIFPYNTALIGLIFALSILVLLLTILLDGWLQKYGLPFLAFPFLLCLWIVLLVFQQYEGSSGFDVFLSVPNHALSIGSYSVQTLSECAFWSVLPQPLLLYLKSLGFVFFQTDIISGICLAVALLCFSRIAFSFSFFGFIVAYLCYDIFNFDIFHLPFIYFGFNFIFTSLALGGCYLVPSKSTFAWVMLLIPTQYLIIFSSTRFLSYFMLPTFSLAFCMVSVLFLYLMKRRERTAAPYFSYFMEATPEDNIYYHLVNKSRFDYLNYSSYKLPFMGEWQVSQGYNGEYTHKDLWQHAWDFIIEYDNKQFQGDGLLLTDYYCFGKPVIATGAGEVVSLCRDVDDNPVGHENREQNWGNYVVIKHADSLYSVVAHLKKDSIACCLGDSVRQGDLLGLCGNSGLSPYPHLHFQFQSASYVGAPTLNYKLSAYGNRNTTLLLPQMVGIPRLNEQISNLSFNETIAACYAFRAGHRIHAKSDKFGDETWEIRSEYGYSLLYCWETGAKAWFAYRDGDFCFQRYEGSKNTNLYYFFLSNYRVLFLSEKYTLQEDLPLTLKPSNLLGWLQDFLAPFGLFILYKYEVIPSEGERIHQSCVRKLILNKERLSINFVTVTNGASIQSIQVTMNDETWSIQIQ